MDIAIIITICGLGAAVFWGYSDFLAAKASKSISPEITTLLVGGLGAVAFSLFFIFNHGLESWTSHDVLFAISAGIFFGAGLLSFFRGLDEGPVSIVSPIGSAYPLVTTLVAMMVFGDKLSLLQLVGIFLITSGVVVTSGLFDAKKSEKRLTAGVMYAIGTFILWGIGFALLGEAVSSIGWQKATFVDMWFEFLAVVVLLPFLRGKKKFEFKKLQLKFVANKNIFGAAIVQVTGFVILNIGLTVSSSSAIIVAISATYPALTILLALKHFKEKVSLLPMIGAIITVAGVVLLSFASS